MVREIQRRDRDIAPYRDRFMGGAVQKALGGAGDGNPSEKPAEKSTEAPENPGSPADEPLLPAPKLD